MIEMRDNLYLGLPVLTAAEYETIEDVAFGGNARYTLDKIAGMVLQRRPLIASVVEFDAVTSINDYGEDVPLSSEEEAVFRKGLRTGYDFMLGSITYAFYLRNYQASFEPFLQHVPKRSIILPVRKISQLERVKSWIGGRAPHADANTDPGYDDTFETYTRDSRRFFEQSAALNELAESKLKDLLGSKQEHEQNNEDESKDLLGDLADGFNQGTANCVEMYIQSYEQDVLNWLGSSPLYQRQQPEA